VNSQQVVDGAPSMDWILQIETGRIFEYPASLAPGCNMHRIGNPINVEWGAISAEFDRL
jgi:hypothetical protein